MLLDPKRLIDRSIADLTQLSVVLAAEIRDEAPLRSSELRACEEAVANHHKSNPSATGRPQCPSRSAVL